MTSGKRPGAFRIIDYYIGPYAGPRFKEILFCKGSKLFKSGEHGDDPVEAPYGLSPYGLTSIFRFFTSLREDTYFVGFAAPTVHLGIADFEN